MNTIKKILLSVSILLALPAFAEDYKTTFYDYLDNGDFPLAESALAEWEANDRGNPDLFLARFNFLLNKSYKSIVMLDSNTEPQGDSLIIDDSIGSIHEGYEVNDSFLTLAVEAIDKGIATFPDRLDFRFSKATAFLLAKDMDALTQSGIDILKHHKENGGLWKWTGDESLDSVASVETMLEGIHDFESTLLEADDMDELLDLNLKYYPEDHIALTFKGSSEHKKGNKEEAYHYLRRAYEVAPEDMLVVFNYAYINLDRGDKDKARSLYTSILDNDLADEESKESARQMIEYLDTDLKVIGLYQFEFQYLPMMADSLSPGDLGVEILSNVDFITGANLAKFGFSFPEDGNDIKIDVIGEGDDAIVVWTMPQPKEMPLARYIAFVPDKEANNYSQYTLEKSLKWDDIDSPWVLGVTWKDAHSNFGNVPYPASPEDFVNLIKEIVK